MIVAALLIAMNVAAADLPRSGLVPGDHAHQWSEIVSDERAKISLDEAHSGSHVESGQTYPTVLIRGIEPEPRQGFSDFMFAVDCDGSRLAALDAWFAAENDSAGERQTPPNRNFRSLAGFPAELRDGIFAHACGPAWSYKPKK